MRKEHLQLVCDANPEDWGDRWLTMRDCLVRYDAASGPLLHYFSRAWKNRQRDVFRKSQRRRTVAMELVPDREYNEHFADQLQYVELIEHVLSCLDGREHKLFVLWFIHNLSYRDIASACGIPLGTVKSRIHELRKSLRTLTQRPDV